MTSLLAEHPAVRPALAQEPWDPFAAISSYPGLRVEYVEEFRGGLKVRGLTTFSKNLIQIRADLRDRPAKHRSTLAHELVHLERGPFPRFATEREERLVNIIASRRLVPIQALFEAEFLRTARDDSTRTFAQRRAAKESSLARRLGVDARMVRVRLQTLTSDEVAWWMRAIELVADQAFPTAAYAFRNDDCESIDEGHRG